MKRGVVFFPRESKGCYQRARLLPGEVSDKQTWLQSSKRSVVRTVLGLRIWNDSGREREKPGTASQLKTSRKNGKTKGTGSTSEIEK